MQPRAHVKTGILIEMLISSLLPVFCNSVRKCIYSASPIAANLLQPVNNWATVSLRTVVRYHFPRPSERRRVQRHGWVTRMSTANGRKIIMRRALKGRHVLTH